MSQGKVLFVDGPYPGEPGGFIRRAGKRWWADKYAMCRRHGIQERVDHWHWAEVDALAGRVVWNVARTTSGCTVRYAHRPGIDVLNVDFEADGIVYDDSVCFVCHRREYDE